MSTPPPKLLRSGRYRVEETLGEGGQGVVVRARDRLVGRSCVLKWRLTPADRPEPREVPEEYRILAELDHPGIVEVEDAYFEPSLSGPVLVERWVEGRDLTRAADDLDRADLQRIAWELLDALLWLHRAGLRHADVKPANVLLVGDRQPHAVLIDFGLAAAAESPELTGGTSAYLAPELHAGRIGSAADLFALGLTLDQVSRRASRPRRLEELDSLPNRDALDRLIAELLHVDPDERRAAVMEVWRHRLGAPATQPDLPRRLPFVGRRDLLRELERDVFLAFDGRRGPVIELAGRPGVGRARLVERLAGALRQRGVVAVALRQAFSTEQVLERLAVELGVPLDLVRGNRKAGRADDTGVFVRLSSWARTQRVAILLAPEAAACGAGVRLQEDARALTQRLDPEPDGERLSIALVVAPAPTEQPVALELAGLDLADVVELIRRVFAVSEDDAEALGEAARAAWEITRGHPLRLDRLLRVAARAEEIGYREGRFQVDARALRRRAVASPTDVATAWRDDLDEAGQRVVDALVANAGILDRDALAEVTSAPTARWEATLVDLAARGVILLFPGARTPVILGDVPSAPVAGHDLAWSLTTSLAGDPEPLVRARAIAERLEPWLASPAPEAVRPHVLRALGDAATGPAAEVLRLVSAVALHRAHRRDEAEAELARIPSGSAAVFAGFSRDRLVADILLAKAGPDAAAAFLEEATDADDADPRLLIQHAYVELLRGRADAALARAERARDLAAGTEARAMATTMAAVARHRTGDESGARRDFAAALNAWREQGDRYETAICQANYGAFERRMGRAARAVALLTEAVAELDLFGGGRPHAEALLNLGVALSDGRRYAEASRVHGRAFDSFTLAGRRASATTALASRGIARYGAGHLVAARRDLSVAWGRAEADGETVLLGQIATHLARVERLTGRRRGAAQRLRRAGIEAADGSDCARALREPADRAALARDLRAHEPEVRAVALLDRIRSRVAEGRLGAASRHTARLLNLNRRMEQGMSRTEKTAFRAAVVNPAYDALVVELKGLVAPERRAPTGGGEVGIILRRINEAKHRDEALEAVVNGVLRVTPAVRAFVVARAPDGTHQFLAAASTGGGRSDPAQDVSHLVLRDAFESDRPVLVADAAADERLGFAQSVQRLGLRSVACVPLALANRSRAVLYLDSPLERGAFSQDVLPELESYAQLCSTALSLFERAETGEERAKRLDEELKSQSVELESRSRELDRARQRAGHGIIIGRSPAVGTVNELIDRVAASDLSVLITGETGTGKELAAEAIHARSTRRTKPFVAINCGALPLSLAESELFGHEPGAFTGATGRKPGIFRLAHQGTLFLDEIGELDLSLQAKLLRVLETGHVRSLGAERADVVDVRVVAATNRTLRGSAEFREDLYYRIAAVEVEMPPLRERGDDVALLVRHFLAQAGAAEMELEPEALDALQDFDWPGNVRELKNLVDRVVVLAADRRCIRLTDLPQEIWDFRGERPKSLAELEAEAIRRALSYTGGEKKAAAKLLGISRTSLYAKLERIGDC